MKMLAALALTLALTASPATAATPSGEGVGGADCALGVYAQGIGWDPSGTNVLTVRIGSYVLAAPFGVDGYLAVPIPQDGIEREWYWAVGDHNPEHEVATGSGVITCGEPAPAPIADARVRIGKDDRKGTRHDRVWIRSTDYATASVEHIIFNHWVLEADADEGHAFADGTTSKRRLITLPR